jgi:hypothetical protein
MKFHITYDLISETSAEIFQTPSVVQVHSKEIKTLSNYDVKSS